MLRNKLVRSDGSIIDSSVIISCEFTEEVNNNTNLSVGDVTASELTVEILSTDVIQQDEVLTYSIIEDGFETKIGVFKAEKPTVATRTSIKFSAYDNVIKTEKLFSDWLMENQRMFPMNLRTLVEYACSHCGVMMADTDFPHADVTVGKFYADDLTCRQILSWAAAIAGRFVRANADGDLEFAWYDDTSDIKIVPSKTSDGYLDVRDDDEDNVSVQSSNLTVRDDGWGNVTVTATGLSVITSEDSVTLTSGVVIPFIQGKLSYEGYTTDLIECVKINHSQDDVGTIYPDVIGNCFAISENMILGVADQNDVIQIAADLYAQLKDITYVPFSVTIPRTIKIRAGSRVTISDSDGNVFTSYVMKVAVAPGGTTLTATGDKYYGSNAAVSSEKYSNLTGKILELSKTIDGLVVKNQDLEGNVSGLELSTESFKTYVENTFVSGDSFETYKSSVEQTSKDITEKFESLDEYRNKTEANIKTGLLDYTDDNQPVFGIEIGQQTENAEGVKTFDKYARFTSDKLSFYDRSGNEVASVGDEKMIISNIEITGIQKQEDDKQGYFAHGKFIDIARADGTIVSKWIGG